MIRIVGYAFVDDPDLIQTSKDGQQFAEVIKQLETTEAYKTLGVWLAADGNHNQEVKILKGFAKELADRIQV